MTSFLRALPRLLDPDPEADPMEQELTREQVEAMDETMTVATHRVTQLHRRRELADHFAPGVIEGPRDCQEHHDWEDNKRLACEGWGRLSLQIKALIALVLVLAGIAVGAFLGTRLGAWLSTLDLSALAHISGGKS